MSTDDLVSPLRVVSMRDPAIDWYAMQEHGVTARVYAETRDPGSVIALPGQHPRWYHLRPLTVSECAFIDALTTDTARALGAFRLAVTRIENAFGPAADLLPELYSPMPDGSQRVTWSDAGLQRVANFMGGMRLLYEIGGIAHERAAEGNGRSGDVLFTPPLFLQPELDRIRRLCAERRQTSAGTASSAPTPEPSQSA